MRLKQQLQPQQDIVITLVKLEFQCCGTPVLERRVCDRYLRCANTTATSQLPVKTG